MAKGKCNAAIAATLILCERAVEKHINSIFSKLHLIEEPDVNRRVKAVFLYLGAEGGRPHPPLGWRHGRRRGGRRPHCRGGRASSVMIVDDQPPFRAAARAVVSRFAGFDLVAEVASGEEAVATSGALRPDLVLMDINMGELDGIEATRMITDAHPDTKVILVSTYAPEDLPAGARSSGAIAYVNKDELSPRVVRRLWESGGDPAWLTSA